MYIARADVDFLLFTLCSDNFGLIIFLFSYTVSYSRRTPVVLPSYSLSSSNFLQSYGDISPKLPGTRLFALFYLFVTIVTTGKALSAFGTLFETEDDTNQKLLNKQLDEHFLAGLDQDGGGEVSEFEYLSAMLVLLEYVEQDDINRVMKAFRKLDTDGSCTLSVSDLKHNLKRNRMKKKGGNISRQ